MTGRKETSALDYLDSLIEETPKVRRTARRERLRLELARFMKKAREEAGLTQKEVAEVLSVTQAWVSKLESPNHDHKLESVLSYFDAIGGEMSLSVDVGASTFQIWGDAPAWGGLVAVQAMEEGFSSQLFYADNLQQAWGYWQPEPTEAAGTRSGEVIVFERFVNGQADSWNTGLDVKEANVS